MGKSVMTPAPSTHAEADEQSSSAHYTQPYAQGSTSHDLLPSSLLQKHTEYDDMELVTTTDPFLQVEVLSPPLQRQCNSQPITPSPQAHSTNAWKVRSSSSSADNHLDFCQEGNRIGCDGTTQTASMQLLKPTASSLGHQISMASFVTSQPVAPSWTPKTKDENSIPSQMDSSFISSSSSSQRRDFACDVLNVPFRDEGSEHCTKKMAYTVSYTSPMNPFGKLGSLSTAGSGSVTSGEDEGITMGQMSPNIMSAEATMEEGLTSHRGGFNNMSRQGVHRRASWSQGSKHQHQRKRGFSGSNRGDNVIMGPERLRSFIMDPVASQLLRECAVHDDDEEEHEFDSVPFLSYSSVSEADPSLGGEETDLSCHSSIQSSTKGSFFRYSSMPDLFRSHPPPSREGREVVLPPTSVSSSDASNFPLSQNPLFRNLSDRLLDVKIEDNCKSLVRPVPRKLSVSTISTPSPRIFDVMNSHEP